MLASTELFSAHEEAARRRVPVAEVLGEREQSELERKLSRRELLVTAAGLATTAALATNPALSFASSLRRSPAPRIAIVGSGLAGVRCAHQLWNAKRADPIASMVFEANPERIGGRCWTLVDAG